MLGNTLRAHSHRWTCSQILSSFYLTRAKEADTWTSLTKAVLESTVPAILSKNYIYILTESNIMIMWLINSMRNFLMNVFLTISAGGNQSMISISISIFLVFFFYKLATQGTWLKLRERRRCCRGAYRAGFPLIRRSVGRSLAPPVRLPKYPWASLEKCVCESALYTEQV